MPTRRDATVHIRHSALAALLAAALGGCRGATATEAKPLTTAPQTADGAARLAFTAPTTMFIGAEVNLTATAYNAAGRIVYPGAPQWLSSAPDVVQISADGHLTSLGIGVATITATSGAASASADIVSRPQSLVVRPYSTSIAIGDSVLVTAVFTDYAGRPMRVQPTVSWTSSNPTAVSVNASGWVFGLRAPTVDRLGWSSSQIAAKSDLPIAPDGSVSVSVAPYTAGQPATLRYVHAASALGPLEFVPDNGAPIQLSYGESVERAVLSGHRTVDVGGFPASPPTTWGQSFSDLVAPGEHLSLYAVGDAEDAYLLPLSDAHPPVPSDKSMQRIVMGSRYAPNYYGANVYFLPAGRPIDDNPLACYFDLGGILDYGLADPGTYDVVLVSPPGFNPSPGDPGIEYARMHVTLQAGRATTIVIMGDGPGSMRLITLSDP